MTTDAPDLELELVVPDPATEPVTVAQLDAEPTPIWDELIRERPNPLPLPGTPRIYLADLAV